MLQQSHPSLASPRVALQVLEVVDLGEHLDLVDVGVAKGPHLVQIVPELILLLHVKVTYLIIHAETHKLRLNGVLGENGDDVPHARLFKLTTTTGPRSQRLTVLHHVPQTI